MGRLSIPTSFQINEAIRIANKFQWKPDPDIAQPKKYSKPDYAMSLEQVGAELGVTRERVRQIEARALTKCRAYLAARYPGTSIDDLLRGGS